MFNCNSFNRTYFNRQKINNIRSGAILFVGSGITEFYPAVIIYSSKTFTGAGTFSIDQSIYGSVTFSGAGTIDFKPRVISYVDHTFSGAGTIDFKPRILYFADHTFTGAGTVVFFLPTWGAATFTGTGTIDFSGKKIIWSDHSFSGTADFILLDAIITTIARMSYTGSLVAGDILVIDTENFTADLNGSDVTYLISGEFLNLSPGENLFTFSKKTVSFATEWTDRHL